MSNVLSAIRALQEPCKIKKSIDDYRYRILSSNDTERESIDKRIAVAEHMHMVKSQFNKYSTFIEHCLVSNSWYVEFRLVGTESFEDVLYINDDNHIQLYAVLFCRFKVELKTPLFLIRLDKEQPIEYGLYDNSDLTLSNYPVEQIFKGIDFNLSYDLKLMSELGVYRYTYTGLIPVDVPEIGLYKNIKDEEMANANKMLKLYYGTATYNHERIKKDGIPADMVVDTYEAAMQIFTSEAGSKDIILYEVWVDSDDLDKPMSMVDVSGNTCAKIYALKKGITDISHMKLVYKAPAVELPDESSNNIWATIKSSKSKGILENQITFL